MILRKFLIKSGSFFFRFRNFLFPALVVFLFLFIKPSYFLGSRTLDNIIVALGITIALAGQAIRFLVIGFAYIKRGGRNGQVFADDLVKEGFYNHVRNPMYVANFLILSGLGMICGSPWVYFLIIPFFGFVYLAIVVTEEDYLRGRFGSEYEEYCKRVNRFLPNLSGIRESLGRFSYDWRKAIRKDFGTFLGVLIGCHTILLWKRYYFYTFPSSKSDIAVSESVFILIVICYVWILYLKKTGRLKSPYQ